MQAPSCVCRYALGLETMQKTVHKLVADLEWQGIACALLARSA